MQFDAGLGTYFDGLGNAHISNKVWTMLLNCNLKPLNDQLSSLLGGINSLKPLCPDPATDKSSKSVIN